MLCKLEKVKTFMKNSLLLFELVSRVYLSHYYIIVCEENMGKNDVDDI